MLSQFIDAVYVAAIQRGGGVVPLKVDQNVENYMTVSAQENTFSE